MHISFDNLDELKDFLAFIGEGPRVTYAVGDMSITKPVDASYASRVLDAYAEAGYQGALPPDEAQTPEQAAQQGVGNEQTEAPEPVKRKRRTKAEMQADAERATGLQQPGTLPEGVGTEPGASTPEGGNAAVQAALAGDTAGAAAALASVPIGDSPFAAPAAAAETKPAQAAGKLPAVAKPSGPEETRAWIEMTAVGKFNAITPVDHMNLAKNFIAAKGMSAYNESFGLVGLSNNIMGFTQEQRALHAAALDFLDWE